MVAALSRAVSAGLAGAPIDGSVVSGGGVPAAGGGGALEAGGETVVCDGDDGLSLQAIADKVRRTANAVAQTLFRVRRTLIDCVSRLAEGGAS